MIEITQALSSLTNGEIILSIILIIYISFFDILSKRYKKLKSDYIKLDSELEFNKNIMDRYFHEICKRGIKTEKELLKESDGIPRGTKQYFKNNKGYICKK